MDKVSIENLEHESRQHNGILLLVPIVLYEKLSKIFSTSFSSNKKNPNKTPISHTSEEEEKTDWSENKKMKCRARNTINRLITSGEKKGLFCNFAGWEGFKC